MYPNNPILSDEIDSIALPERNRRRRPHPAKTFTPTPKRTLGTTDSYRNLIFGKLYRNSKDIRIVSCQGSNIQ